MPKPKAPSPKPTLTDAFLLLMVAIWGANYSVVKVGLEEIPTRAFNALRMTIAISVYFLVLWIGGRARTTDATTTRARILERSTPLGGREWIEILGLGFVGHFLYQVCFVDGLARTSVANSSLILALIPAAVTLLSALVGHERITGRYWLGLAISLTGIYLVVGQGARLSSASAVGDALTFAAVGCWALYSVGARSLLARHSPLVVTSYTMGVGGGAYVLWNAPTVVATDWSEVTAVGWGALVFSSLLALNVGYLIWYSAVQRIGNARTSVYSNITPIIALAVGALWLGEHVPLSKWVGAAAIMLGVMVTRRAAPALRR